MEKIVKKKTNRILITTILVAVIFGLAGGVVGEIITRVYFLDNAFNIPFFGKIDVINGNFGRSSVIISDAKKVVVEQDVKVMETINSVSNVIVGIFKKLPPAQASDPSKKSLLSEGAMLEFNMDSVYNYHQPLGQGLIITSDGWIITSFLPKEIVNSKSTVVLEPDILQKYVVITKDKKIYPIDKIIKDSLSSFIFMHVNVRDFPVRKLAGRDEINRGQSVVAVNWNEQGWLTFVITDEEIKKELVNFSDSLGDEIFLVSHPSDVFKGSFLFNMSGDVMALLGSDGRVLPLSNFFSAIQSTLRHKIIKRASLGIYYVNLWDIVQPDLTIELSIPQDKGALIYKNTKGVAVLEEGAGFLAGLKEGDIIISVDNREIDKRNNLTEILLEYVAGENINVVYLRNNEQREVSIKLGEIE